MLTLRFLASGNDYHSLSYSFRIGLSTISGLVPEALEAIYEALKNHIHMPTTSAEWLCIAHDFEEKWHFPYVLGNFMI
jgi:hypothetical protein